MLGRPVVRGITLDALLVGNIIVGVVGGTAALVVGIVEGEPSRAALTF